MQTLSSSSSSHAAAPKVLPSGGSTARAESVSANLPDVLFSDTFRTHQPAHYGPQDLLACTLPGGDGRVIFIYDMNSVQLVQTLQGHAAVVTSVLWQPPKLSYLRHGLCLISGDQSGTLLLWDVAEGIVISRIQVPCRRPVQVLSLLPEQHLLAITDTANSYVFNAHLADTTVLPPAPLPLRCKEGPRPPLRFATSKLSLHRTSVLVMGDRARIVSHLDPGREARPTARDLIYDSEDGAATVIDAFFSGSVEEVLYFATRKSVGSYDWRVGMVLNEQMLWTRDDVEFVRLFPSSAATLDGRAAGLPFMYSLTTDQRLTAWFLLDASKFTTVSTDVRGARIASKAVAGVEQSDLDPALFAVLLDDGSIAKWEYSAGRRRWRLTHYFACPVQRPTSLCRAGVASGLCCALECGHVAVVDARHSTALKRMNLVYSGGTRITLLCPHRHNDSVWVVSNRISDGRNHHQVSLLDVHSGEVARVLRKPSATAAELSKAKSASMDPSCTYLLLSFWNGTFEVWNTEDGHLLHMHAGLGVASVSWAPPGLRRCLTGVQGVPQLLSVIFSEGTMSLWSVYKDRCIVSRDAVPLLNPAAIIGGSVQALAVADHLVVFDSVGSGHVVEAKGTRLTSRRFRDQPATAAPVRGIAGTAPAAALSSSFASLDAFSASAVDGADAEGPAMVTAVAVVFGDGSFGVWNVATGERLGLSTTSPALRGVTAASVVWLDDALAVLCEPTGSILVTDRRLSSVNSAVSSRALRRPLQNPSFLLPAQRTFLQTSLELMLPPADSRSGSEEGGRAAVPVITAQPPPGEASSREETPGGSLPMHDHDHDHLHRGPFGQLVGGGVRSFEGEMARYQRTMLPRWVARPLAAAARSGERFTAAFWAARWFGQLEKQRLWGVASRALTCPAAALCDVRARDRDGDSLPEHCDQAGVPYTLGDAYSVACAPAAAVRHNRLSLAELRCSVLRGGRYTAADDSGARQQVAQELLRLGESERAVEALLDCCLTSPELDKLSTLALAVAAGAAVLKSGQGRWDGGSHPASAAASLFTLSTKRAAAMLLAAGEVDAAVEKFTLAGEYAEACRALESQGRWHEAATLTKESALPAAARQSTLRRYAQQCARVDAGAAGLPATRMLLSEGLATEALAILAASAHLTDMAGVLALALSDQAIPKPTEPAESAVLPSQQADELSVALLAVLADYGSVLDSVGNKAGEALVLRRIAAMKEAAA